MALDNQKAHHQQTQALKDILRFFAIHLHLSFLASIAFLALKELGATVFPPLKINTVPLVSDPL
ncbi:hypothetical protein [Legionella wadsworthii]|uniref:hypothetical protein n=1 Tax=Legionella wadsworthii TaxID=28088 RepID=UPI000ADAF491